MDLAAFIVSIVAALAAGGSAWYARVQARAAKSAVAHARTSAEAATRSADVAEVVERGRHFGWRLEARASDSIYTLRNVGTVDARDVKVSGNYTRITLPTGDAAHVTLRPGRRG